MTRTVCYSNADRYGAEASEDARKSLLSLLILKRLTLSGMKPEGFHLHIFRLHADEKQMKRIADKKMKEHLFLIRKAPGKAILFADSRGLIFLLKKGVQRKELDTVEEREAYRELFNYQRKVEGTGGAKKKQKKTEHQTAGKQSDRCKTIKADQ